MNDQLRDDLATLRESFHYDLRGSESPGDAIPIIEEHFDRLIAIVDARLRAIEDEIEKGTLPSRAER